MLIVYVANKGAYDVRSEGAYVTHHCEPRGRLSNREISSQTRVQSDHLLKPELKRLDLKKLIQG